MLDRWWPPASGAAGRVANVQVSPPSSLRPTRIVPRGRPLAAAPYPATAT